MVKNTTNKVKSELLDNLVETLPNKGHIVIDAMNDFVLPAEWNFTNRVNANYHLALIKGGKGYYEYEGKRVPYEPGSVFLFGRKCQHSRGLDVEELPRMTLIRFEVVDNTTGMQAKHMVEGQGLNYVTSRVSFFYELIERLLAYYKEQTPSASRLAELCLTQIIYEMHRDLNETVRKDPRLENVCDYIKGNYATKLQLEDMVAISGLTRNYFLKLFKDTYKITPKQYHIRVRMDQATKYLTETDLKISGIAELLGYKDQFAFSKQFKEVMGKSPSEIRKSYVEPGMV